MSEMVDRVAEALAQSFRDTVARVSGTSWEETGVTLPSKEVFERYAGAAITAMREPTQAMLERGRGAGWHGGIEGYWPAEEESAKALFCDMIDEALK